MAPLRALALASLALSACVTTEGPQGKGGAQFQAAAQAKPAVPIERLYDVCWPLGSLPSDAVTLTFTSQGTQFETQGGATNSTARCLREIAESWPWDSRPDGKVEVKPPAKGPQAFAVLAWVKLLSESRYPAERGVRDPGPLAAACFAKHGLVRAGTRFEVNQNGLPLVRTIPAATTDTERCLEAVLSATVWPSTREFSLDFEGGLVGAPPADGDVSGYFAPDGDAPSPLDPQAVHDSIALKRAGVSACWESALARRAAIAGGRTVRFRTTAQGTVERAWIGGNLSDTRATAADLWLDRCLLDVVKTLRVEGAGVGEGLYTWVFASPG
jgi:hypothetical protein